MTRFWGLVERRLVAPGSKSDRSALVLVTDHGEYRLKRSGENPFEQPGFRHLVGSRIVCDGTTRGGALIVSRWWLDAGSGDAEG